ncbi:MAG: hypothetical protein AWU59_358 [Methanolobus sp. T82-4]|jgi:uncharacterized protein YunC (DUF1805 family)|nr:MAG: hypothetical protein AWU59_358 [Methanolobus sp. T82-4]
MYKEVNYEPQNGNSRAYEVQSGFDVKKLVTLARNSGYIMCGISVPSILTRF